MERIRDHWRGGMTWRQPRPLVPEFELRRGAYLFAELAFPGGWRLGAEARAFDREWSFEQKGFWRHVVSMIDRRTGDEVLEVRLPVWRKALLKNPQGRQYVGRAGLAQYRIEDDEGDPIIRFPHKIRLFRFEADLELTEDAALLPEMPELVVAGWFLAVLASHQSAAAAVGTGGGATATG